MRNMICLILMLNLMVEAQSQQQVTSPDGNITVRVQSKDGLDLSIFMAGEALVDAVRPRMVLKDKGVLGTGGKLLQATQKEVHQTIEPVVPTKSAVISDDFQLLKLAYENYDFEIRGSRPSPGLYQLFSGRERSDLALRELL